MTHEVVYVLLMLAIVCMLIGRVSRQLARIIELLDRRDGRDRS